MSDPPPWYQQCVQNISKIPGGTLCSAQKCQDVANYIHTVCNCKPPYYNGCWPNPTPGCCSYSPSSPIFVADASGGCYCCCGGVGTGEVAVSADGAKPLSEVSVGDTVHVALDAALREWALVPVAFSAGVGQGGPGLAIRIGDQDGPRTVLTTPDHLFLVDGRLKRAARLAPGDRLTRSDGTPVQIVGLTAVELDTPLHRVATSKEPAHEVVMHLLAVDGLMVGDYALQLADLDKVNPKILAEGHAALPEFGSREHAARHGVGDAS
jgi:hypothetical protein